MYFYEQLNEYIKILNCTAKELSSVSGISAAALSRYRSGDPPAVFRLHGCQFYGQRTASAEF